MRPGGGSGGAGGAGGIATSAGAAADIGVGAAVLGAGGSGGQGSSAARTDPMCVSRSGLLAAASWQPARHQAAPATKSTAERGRTRMGRPFTARRAKKRGVSGDDAGHRRFDAVSASGEESAAG